MLLGSCYLPRKELLPHDEKDSRNIPFISTQDPECRCVFGACLTQTNTYTPPCACQFSRRRIYTTNGAGCISQIFLVFLVLSFTVAFGMDNISDHIFRICSSVKLPNTVLNVC